MRFLFIVFGLTAVSLSWAALPDWKVIAETIECSEKIQIIAKDGEKFIFAVKGAEKIKLIPQDGSVFLRDNPKVMTYESEVQTNGDIISVNLPSVVQSALPKIYVSNKIKNDQSKKCRVGVN